jgi:hypothetical protein
MCEALIKALTFWCYGYRNVTASYGSIMLKKLLKNEDRVEELKNSPAMKLLCLISSSPGDDAAS